MSIVSKRGFTIVELLIVIVVIGILAAITIVAYNGMQKRAGNAAREHTANEMLKIVKAYVVLNGVDPLKNALPEPYSLINSSACVGSGFVDANSDGRGDCFSYTPPQAEAVSSNSTIDSLLATTGMKGSGVYPPVKPDGTYTTNGSWLLHWPATLAVNNEIAPLLFAYWVDGNNHRCSVGTQIRFDYASGAISYYIDDPQTVSWSTGSGATLCAVHVK